MPDELIKAQGVHFAPPPRSGIVSHLLGLGASRSGKREILSGKGEFAGFLEVLKARCEVWGMGGNKDWRRREAEENEGGNPNIQSLGQELLQEDLLGVEEKATVNLGLPIQQGLLDEVIPEGKSLKRSATTAPKKYLLAGTDPVEAWDAVCRQVLPAGTPTPVSWDAITLSVYGRSLVVPRCLGGVAYWTFPELCMSTYGPADYLTMASTFHTFIVDEVPVLTLLLKNEARRLAPWKPSRTQSTY